MPQKFYLQIICIESQDVPVYRNPMQNSPFDLIRHGGFMMIPLLISALVALTLIFERLYYFKKTYFVSKKHLYELEEQVRNEKFTVLLEISGAASNPLLSILKTGAEAYSLPPEDLEKHLARKAQTWVPELEKRLEVLDTIITAAPLMGLLGTITGMMASFQVLSSNGVNEPNAITGGVAEALIATATGLVIALVSLLFFNYFNSKVRQTIDSMETLSNLFLEKKSEQKVKL